MPIITPTLPTPGQPNTTEDVDTLNALIALRDLVNGALDADNIAAKGVTADEIADTLAEWLGVNSNGVTRRGKCIVPGADVRANVAYGKLATPDEVTVTLPADGLIAVFYQAIWQNSTAGAGRAALFLDATQVKSGVGTGVPVTTDAAGPAEAGDDAVLFTSPGLSGYLTTSGGVGASTEVATGQIVGSNLATGGPVYIFAAAGTYVVSVQCRSTSGSVTVKGRKLLVEAIGF